LILVSNSADTSSPRSRVTSETSAVLAGENKVLEAFNSKVYVIPNFLPNDLATRWRDRMNSTWNVTSASQDTCTEETSSSWLYATNNHGEFLQETNNAKVRSATNTSQRNTTAYRMRESGLFSYAKWELDPNHDLFKEIEDYLSSEGVVHRVTSQKVSSIP
jgi:hypothetical protein